MKPITVEPGRAGSGRLEDIQESDIKNGSVLVDAVAVGVRDTYVGIADCTCTWAPPGKTRLMLDDESLGCVLDAGKSSRLRHGDLVVGIVHRPNLVPSPAPAVGEWDMCRNGQYAERGIRQVDGYMSERWRIEPGSFMKVESTLGILRVLMPPATVVGKALSTLAASGAVCLTGVGQGGAIQKILRPGRLSSVAVLKNHPMIGTVDAKMRHWCRAANILTCADRSWRGCLITKGGTAEESRESHGPESRRHPSDYSVLWRGRNRQMRHHSYWRPFLSEFIDWALILMIGLALVIVMFTTSISPTFRTVRERLQRIIGWGGHAC